MDTMNKRTWVMVAFVFLFASIVLIGCQSDQADETEEQGEEQGEEEQKNEIDLSVRPVVTMTMEDGGTIEMELYPDVAPNTVNNFISLVEDGFYDGLIFHRVIPGFMIQGGDPDGVGTGGPGYSIKGEFEANGVENDVSHERGVLSMARSQHPDSAGSQFFIMVADSGHLDGEYAAFGKVIDGIDVADEIVSQDTDPNDKPNEDQVIADVVVDLHGYEPAEVVKE